MEIVKKINQEYTGEFCLLDYHISHSQLLIRRTIILENGHVNFDMIFDGVDYLEIPKRLNGMYICNGEKEDWEYIASKYNDELFPDNEYVSHQLYKIISEKKVYYILAGQIRIDTNNLLALNSSIIKE